MQKQSYIQRVCRDLASESPQQQQRHEAYLLTLLELVQGLPSPHRENALVELLVNPQRLRPPPPPPRRVR